MTNVQEKTMKIENNGNAKIHLRPHHILCLSLFEGKGYNEKFIENIQSILHNFQNIQIVSSADDICKSCPNNVHGECSLGEEDVRLKDRNACTSLNLQPGDISVESINLKLSMLSKIDFEKCCGTCRWYEAKVCRFENIKQF